MLKLLHVCGDVHRGGDFAGEAIRANRAANDEFGVVPARDFDLDAAVIAIRGDLRQCVGGCAVVANVVGAAGTLGDGVLALDAGVSVLCHGLVNPFLSLCDWCKYM